MKRHIAIPLLCVVLVAALSTSVFATSLPGSDSSTFPYPENNLDGFGFVTVDSVFDPKCTLFTQLDFGDMFCGKFIDNNDPIASYNTSFSFNLSVNVISYLYIAVPCFSPFLSHDFGALSSYRDSTLDYDVSFGEDWPLTVYTADYSTGTFASSSGTGNVNVTFFGFSDVPVGDYTISLGQIVPSDAPPIVFGVYSSGNTGGGSTDPDNPGSGGSGATGNSGYTGFNKIVDKFQNGSITYTDALDQLGDRYDFIHTTDIYQNLLYVNEYQMSVDKLNGLVSSSAAAKSNSLDTQMQGTIDQFADGSIDLKGAMDGLSGDFSTALSGAQTVEEAQAVTAVYQANLRQLETRNQMKMMQAFDDAMSDEEFQEIQDYYAAEGELINAFDVADFDAQLQFDNWFLLLPQKEAFDYKRFFDYLLNDSEIRHFIIIPLTMGLVSIIMGTRMRVRPSSGGKGDDD